MNSLKWTGERIIPEEGRYMFERHLKAYKFADDFCKNKKILDAGCGEGYGSCFISDNATEVIGIDISEEAIQHARRKYNRDTILGEIALPKIPVNPSEIAGKLNVPGRDSSIDHVASSSLP